jgi:hypothetical protein
VCDRCLFIREVSDWACDVTQKGGNAITAVQCEAILSVWTVPAIRWRVCEIQCVQSEIQCDALGQGDNDSMTESFV